MLKFGALQTEFWWTIDVNTFALYIVFWQTAIKVVVALSLCAPLHRVDLVDCHIVYFCENTTAKNNGPIYYKTLQ